MSKLQQARLMAGLSAYQLATTAGTREPRIYAFERDRFSPRPDEAKAIAQVLHGDVDELFPGLARKRGRQ